MDRIVCLIVLTVVASLVFEISSAAAIAIPEVQNDDNQSVQKPQSKADVELVQPVDTERTYYSANQRPARRNQLFDNIFRVNFI